MNYQIRERNFQIDQLLKYRIFFYYSYHQKYRLQGHKDLAKALGLTSDLLQKSYIAARLNGYLVGVGGMEQFLKEVDTLGLTKSQIEYVQRYVQENEGGGLFC